MRVLEAAYHGGTRIFSERPFGYKRYIESGLTVAHKYIQVYGIKKNK